MRRRLLLAAALSLLAACSVQPQRPSATLKTAARETFYDVSGSTAEELYAQMRAKGLRRSRGVLFGDYLWDLSWDYQYASAWYGGSCAMTAVKLQLEAQTILPNWSPPPGTEPVLVQQWYRFVDALKAHEKGHVEIAARAAEDLREALRDFSAPDCGQMKAAAERRAAELLKRHRQLDDQYDLNTGYGTSQNANWPPAPPARP